MRKTFTLLTMVFLFTGALLNTEPAPSARRVDLQPIAFVTYIHYPYQEDAAAMLVDSIRAWGGEYRDCPICAVLTDPKASGLRLKDKNVQLVPLELKESVRNYLFAAKAYAAAKVESLIAGKARSLAWFDPETMLLRSPREMDLKDGISAAVAPVAFINTGQAENEPVDAYWAAIYKKCSLDPKKLFIVETKVDCKSGRPLDLALDGGHAAVIDLLKSKGARPTPLEFETFRLAEKVHRIAYPWGMRNNIIVFSGPDGILIVDTGFSKHAVDALKKTIGGLARGEIKYIVNTHPHGDHIEGNGIAPSEANVIGFQNLDGPEFKNLISKSDQPLRGRAGRELQAPYVMPFNREDIQIIPNPGLHSQADILIYFPKSQVLCMGDLLLSQNCPAVQDVAGYMDFLDKILDVFPSGVTFVGGHGKDLTADGLKKYRDDLAGMIATVKKNYAAGKSAEDMIRDDVLKNYKAEYSFLDWIGPDSWVQRTCQGLRSGSLK